MLDTFCHMTLNLIIGIKMMKYHMIMYTAILWRSLYKYLHFHYESLNEPLHLRCGSYIHEQIDLSHTNIRAI